MEQQVASEKKVRKPKKTEFKKGHIPSKSGVMSYLRKEGFDRSAINEKIVEVLTMTRDDSVKMKANGQTTNFELIVLSMVESSIHHADGGKLDHLLEKVFGKSIVSGVQEINFSSNMNVNVLSTDENLLNRAVSRAMDNKVIENQLDGQANQ